MKRNLVTLFIAFWGATVSVVFAQTIGWERQSLRGLKGVYLVIAEVPPEAKREILTTNQLRTEVKLRLRKAGIQVLTWEEWLETLGKPFLYVRVHSVKGGDLKSHVFSIDVSLEQEVSLMRSPDIKSHAVTWKTSTIVIVNNLRLLSIRNKVVGLIDKFTKDYLAVSPK